MGLYRNLFICSCVCTVFAIFAHGLAMGLPYWIYHTINVKMHNQYVDVLAYEGLFKTCIEYDDSVPIKNCTVYCKYNIYLNKGGWGTVMVFNATSNNISVISWRSVLLVEEAGVSGKNTGLPQVTDKLSQYAVSMGHCVVCSSIYGFWLPLLVFSNSS